MLISHQFKMFPKTTASDFTTLIFKWKGASHTYESSSKHLFILCWSLKNYWDVYLPFRNISTVYYFSSWKQQFRDSLKKQNRNIHAKSCYLLKCWLCSQNTLLLDGKGLHHTSEAPAYHLTPFWKIPYSSGKAFQWLWGATVEKRWYTFSCMTFLPLIHWL